MQITLESDERRNLIQRYDAASVQINEVVYTTSLLVTPDDLQSDWSVTSIDDLAESHVDAIASLAPDLVIVGTGTTLRFPRPLIHAGFAGRGIGVEFMDNAAACRTYNVVATERRRVVCALIMPPSRTD